MRNTEGGTMGVWFIFFGIVIAAAIIYAVLTTPEAWGTNPIRPDDLLYPFIMGGK